MQQLSERLPILEVAADCIVSKMGDVSVGLEVTKPEIFTMGTADYELLHQAFVKALKVLPEGTVVHLQDIFRRDTFEAKGDEGKKGFLSEASDRFFEGRPFLRHRSRIFITRRPAGRRSVSSGSSGLLRKFLVPADTLKRSALREFEACVGQFCSILADSGLVKLRRIPTGELVSSAGSAGVIEQYCYLLDEGSVPVIRDIGLVGEVRVGELHTALFTLADPEKLPGKCSPWSAYERYSTDRSRVPVGFTSGLGLLLPFDHIYNQYIVIEDQAATIKRLESKRLRLQSLANYSRENALSRDATNAVLNEAISHQLTFIKAHFSVMVWTDRPDELREIANRVGSAMASIDAVAHRETMGAAQLWWSAIPGNAGDLPENECFDTFLEQGCCFLNMETNYRGSESSFGIRFGDRLTGCPVNLDLDIEPKAKGLIGNGNLFVLSGSGGGKSYLMAHLCHTYYSMGMHLVIVDVGRSYQTLCRLVGGVYLTYEDDNPISFNPFYVLPGEAPDIEKKESIKALLLALWKRSDEEHFRSEYVAISNLVGLYYDRLHDHPDIFPGFDSFYVFARDEYVELLRRQGIGEKVFDVQNFLYVLRPYAAGGEFDFLLNARKNLDLLDAKFIVFELSNITGHAILFQVVTMVIVEVFMSKVRQLRGVRKMIVIEEAWKAIASSNMADEIRSWVKTLRKYMGKLALVSQELDDIVDSPIIKQAVINSSDCKILLDQSKFQNRFNEIQELLGLTDKQKAEILSINKGHEPGRMYKDCWIGLGASWSKVFRLETSLEEYLAFTSEEGEKVKIDAYAERHGSFQKGIEVLAAELRRNHE